MKKLHWAAIALCTALTLGVAVQAVRVAGHYRGLRTEVGRVAVTRIEDATKERIERLRDRVFITYYVTERSQMPSHLRRLEREVTDFLQALKDASDGKVDFQIIDPETDPDLAGYAAKRRVSPFRVRHISRDAYTVQKIWSSLTIAYGPHKPAEINGVTLDHVPRLQQLFVEQLDQMEAPRQPVVAIAPESGFTALHQEVSKRARVVRLDLDGGEEIPSEVDALLWVDARVVTPERLKALNDFVESGRSLVIAGAEYTPEVVPGVQEPMVRLAPTGYPAGELLGEFGLRPSPALICDGFGEKLKMMGSDAQAPFLIRCIAPNQDFYNLKNQPNGTLLFGAPSVFEIDSERLAERAWTHQILATTSDKTWVQPRPKGQVPLSEFALEKGEHAPKQPLIVMLRPDDPWQGLVFAFAASTAFQDGVFDAEGVAHWRMLRTLLDNMLSDEQLVLTQVNVHKPPPLPAMSAGARLAWRSAVVALIPGILLLLAFLRGAHRGARDGAKKRTASGAPIALRLGALVVGTGVASIALGWLADALALRADLTEDKINSLAPQSEAIAEKAVEEHATEVELIFSGADRLPPDMRAQVGRVRDTLRALERAGADLSVTAIDPADLDDGERAALAAEGVSPTKSVTRVEETSTVRTIFSTVRMSTGEGDARRTELLTFPDARAFENLEFRLVFALWRLQTGRRPRIAFCPDLPRPSSAEAYEYYQMQGLFSPMGVNVSSLAMELLESCGFELVYVNPRAPEPPEGDIDLFLWMQPRRPVDGILDMMTEYLHQRGNVLIAAQHFRIQSRQYRGTNFVFNYWPQPQSPDVELKYFPDLGLNMIREVLFDELKTRMVLPSQINGRGSQRLFENMEHSQHFLIRAAASNFDQEHKITRGIGDQAFLCGNFLEIDGDRLDELELDHRVLMSTTERTWKFLWEGGWLPEEMLAGPPDEDGDGTPETLGRLPLAALVEGQFPLPEDPFHVPYIAPGYGEGIDPEEAKAEAEAKMEEYKKAERIRRGELFAAPGRLLFVTGSEQFKNSRLYEPEFRADHLLLNAVTTLCLPPDLSDVATRRHVARGFDYVEPGDKLWWRGVVFGLGPALLLLFGAVRALVRRSSGP